MSLYNKATILIVEDEELLRRSIRTYFEDSGYRILCAENGRKALELLNSEPVDIVFADLIMPVMGGLDLIKELRRISPSVPVIVISGAGSVQDAVEALRCGAWDYLVKPVLDISALESLVRKALEAGGLRREVEGLKQKLLSSSLSNPDAFASINTRSQAMFSIFRYLEVVAPTTQPILLQGGTGTGKELLARAIHLLSGRKGNFVPVNLAGVDEHVFSDTLFGHVRGAFTGADSVRKGLVATAADGTMFLDEIGDLSESSQIKLLRLLQEGEYYPLGTDQSKTGTARFILATHRDLSKMIHEGKFREDLYYRLFSHRVQIPALSERSEDIPLLVDCFLREASEIMGKPVPKSSPELFRLLGSYTFPGNIRELKALVMDAVARSDGQILSMEPFKMVVCSKGDSGNTGVLDSCSEYSLDEGKIPTLKEAESSLIDKALELSNGNQGVAAEMLGISRTALNKRISKMRVRFRNG